MPRCGQHVGWAEASAVVTANSVLGARTNPLPAMIDLVCAILGKAPCCGLHLDENRKGQVLVNVDLSKDTLNELDYALLGFYTADVIGERVPVYTGIPPDVSLECLQAIGVNVPSYLYHVVGVTPEASSVERAFGWDTPQHVVKFGDKELRDMSDRFAGNEQSDVDIVMIGCPHLPLNKVIDYARALDGKRISGNVEVYLLTSASIRSLARESGYEETIERSGATLANMCSLFTNYGDKPSKKVVTTSSLYCQYGPGSPMLATPEECIDAALTGKFTPRR
jgi:predicted aconitase